MLYDQIHNHVSFGGYVNSYLLCSSFLISINEKSTEMDFYRNPYLFCVNNPNCYEFCESCTSVW